MCEYPIRLLPQRLYVKSIKVDKLCAQCTQPFLARRHDGETVPFHYIGGRRILDEGVINNDVLDWSTNLLGGGFKTEDICWGQHEHGTDEWDGEDVVLDNYEGCYEQISACCLFIAFNSLHNITIPYKRRFGSIKDLEQYAEKTNDISMDIVNLWDINNEAECNATINVEHKPTMLNYWHMTIGITPKDFIEPMSRDGKKNKSLKKRVREALHLHILNNIIIEEPQIENIPEDIYIKDDL